MDEALDDTAPPAPPQPFDEPPHPAYARDLQPLDAAYANVIRIRTAITLGVLLIPILIGDLVLAEAELTYRFTLFAPLAALFIWAIIVAPRRIWRSWGYRMTADRLRVAHGNVFSVDTVVPFSRVQHLDVTAGPIERGVGLATLVLHTAGTHNSTVSLPGLKRAEAEQMREDIRARIGAG